MRLVFYNGQLMREGVSADYVFDDKDRLTCYHPEMTDPGQIRIFEAEGYKELGMFEVAFKPRKETESDDVTSQDLESLICLVVEPLRMPKPEALESLTKEQRVAVAKWCGDVHLAASDNDDIEPGPIPECLDNILKWRWGHSMPEELHNIETDNYGFPVDDRKKH